jgi:glutamate dehydrogenase/leucine dehydrogenase
MLNQSEFHKSHIFFLLPLEQRLGVIKVLEDVRYTPDIHQKYKVADMITGYGVAESVRHYYDIWGGGLAGKKVIVQGWGNVGAAAAYYCAQQGAKIVGIIDRVGGLIAADGLSFDTIKNLFLTKSGNTLVHDQLLSFEEVNAQIWDLSADVFLPCAASRLVTDDQVQRMIQAGIQLIASGANVPFADTQIFYGPIAEKADGQISVIPDFIANCGMARVFAYLMSNGDVDMSDAGIFDDTSATIRKALEQVHQVNSNKTRITESAFALALKKLI